MGCIYDTLTNVSYKAGFASTQRTQLSKEN
jgi:glutathionyl-hydroquinone reductase